MKEVSSPETSLCECIHEGDVEEGFLYWGTLLLLLLFLLPLLLLLLILLLRAKRYQVYKSGGHL